MRVELKFKSKIWPCFWGGVPFTLGMWPPTAIENPLP